ncbi:aspartate aminotransferase family protein [Rhizobium sp. 2YAF20]|uniref:aspartate aminotransferase family protein n=1 Tax=Rhizobium sp. 2YAF20 TaxID=3233027 RepID=UPI003F9E5EDF
MTLSYQVASRYCGSAELFEKACGLIPGGVNSTARATWSGWDPHPLFVTHGTGSRVFDVDCNEYIDYLLGLGPMILGHRPPKVTQAVVNMIEQRGTVFALPHEDETALAAKIIAAIPSVEQVRLCNTGTEAVIYALRLARTFTGRQKVIRFEGMYHGFSDGVYWSKHPSLDMAGPAKAPVPVPQGPGMPKGIDQNLIILPWNDLALLRETLEREGDAIAAVLTEPIMCNTGCILPNEGYLEGMRELCDKHGVVLVFDEVITGFRISLGGAQAKFNIRPDLTIMAKGLGGGFPVAALGGRKDIMALVGKGVVSMAGTYSANVIAVAAANAALDELSAPGMYEGLYARCDILLEGLRKIFHDSRLNAHVVGMGPVLQVWFADHPIRNYRDAAQYSDHDLFRKWWEGNLNRGVMFHPGAYENLFVSFAHTPDDIEKTLDIARLVVRDIESA